MPKGFSLRRGDDIPPPLPEKKRNSAGIYELNATDGQLPISFSRSPTVLYRHSSRYSAGSTFSVSSEEILDEPPPKPSRILSSSLDRRDSRSSQYDNMNDSSLEYSSPTDFTDVASDGQLVPPPLPVKKGSSSCPGVDVCPGSPYDNVFGHLSSSNVVSAKFEPGGHSEQLSPPTSRLLSPTMPRTSLQKAELISSTSSNQTVRRYVSKVSEVHQKTFDANVLQSCVIKSSQVSYTETSSTESLHAPPPIPPKKHGKYFHQFSSDLNI